MLNSNKNVVEKTETWTFFIVSYTLAVAQSTSY